MTTLFFSNTAWLPLAHVKNWTATTPHSSLHSVTRDVATELTRPKSVGLHHLLCNSAMCVWYTEFMTSMSCDSVYCMCGAAWSSRWLMMQLTNSQHACVLVFMPEGDVLNILCGYQFFPLYLMNFMFYTMLVAAGDVLTVHYKSMTCDVSFSQGSLGYVR